MAVLCLVRNSQWDRKHTAFMATVRPTWEDEEGKERQTDLFAELETVVDRYREERRSQNRGPSSGANRLDFRPPKR